jgi:hypothetical protein
MKMTKEKFEAMITELVRKKKEIAEGSETAGKSAHDLVKELIDWYTENHKK